MAHPEGFEPPTPRIVVRSTKLLATSRVIIYVHASNGLTERRQPAQSLKFTDSHGILRPICARNFQAETSAPVPPAPNDRVIAMAKLTKTLVESTKAPEKGDTYVWDSELQGFGVRIQASGRKTYIARYRVKNAERTQRKLTIARCSDMPPEKARELARKVFAQVAEGKDPVGERRETVEAPTVTDLQARYMKEHAGPFKKEASAELDEKNWRLHILPAIGSKRVGEVTEAMVLKLFGSLSEKPATANQCLALLSKAMNLAEKWEWRDRNSNPCHGIKKYKVKQRELILTPDQIRKLSESLDSLVMSCQIDKPMADLVRLLMLTGCRLREIMHARREWVDRERNLLILPDSKVGQRKIPLAPASLAIIDTCDSEWLIPGRVKGEPMITPYKAWARIKKHASLPKELRIHDLRHTAGSLGHLAGLSQKEIQLLLGHKQMSTTERYIHGAQGGEQSVVAKISEVITGAWKPKLVA